MALIFDGEAIETTAHVIDWRSHGLQFIPGKHKNVGKRVSPPQLCVVHYTGGENPPPVVYKTLIARELSVEFAMDLHGTIYQFADPATTFCAHCRGMNVVSFGIEVQCRGLSKPPTPALKNTWAKWDVEVPRGAYVEELTWPGTKKSAQLHTQRVSYASFTADQLSALVEFFTSLVDAKIIPARVPANARVRFGLETDKVQGFKGVAGHYHFSAEKFDPGPQLFDELLDEGFSPAKR